MKLFLIGKPLYKLCAINVSVQQNVLTVFKWCYKPKLIKTLSVDFFQVTQYFFWKKWSRWPVERAESFDIQLRYEKQLWTRWDSPFNPRSNGVWRVTCSDGGKGPLPRIFKSNSRRGKIQTALERSHRIAQDIILLNFFFYLWRQKKVKQGQSELIYSNQLFIT